MTSLWIDLLQLQDNKKQTKRKILTYINITLKSQTAFKIPFSSSQTVLFFFRTVTCWLFIMNRHVGSWEGTLVSWGMLTLCCFCQVTVDSDVSGPLLMIITSVPSSHPALHPQITSSFRNRNSHTLLTFVMVLQGLVYHIIKPYKVTDVAFNLNMSIECFCFCWSSFYDHSTK